MDISAEVTFPLVEVLVLVAQIVNDDRDWI